MKSSRMADAVEPSLSRRLFNLAKQYDDVIDLTLGDPDLKPAKRIRDAGSRAIQDGKTRYSANAGLMELRETIAETVSDEYDVAVDPSTNVMVSVGGMEALYLALAATVDPGDEVVIFAPYYVNYVQMVRMLGAKPVVVWTTIDDGFSWTEEQLLDALSERTACIIVNTPSNPIGRSMTARELDAVCRVARERDLLVITDEVYKTLLFDGAHDSVLSREGMAERTVLVDSVSKRFSMTGYRIGFAVGPAAVVADMTKMQENVAACAPLPSQYAALEAYRSCRGDTRIRDEFARRRDAVCDGLARIDGFRFVRPTGTFYVFVDVSATGLTGMEFAYRLLEEQHVAVVPGVTYGERYDGFVRIAFTHGEDVLFAAIDKIATFVTTLQGKAGDAR